MFLKDETNTKFQKSISSIAYSLVNDYKNLF